MAHPILPSFRLAPLLALFGLLGLPVPAGAGEPAQHRGFPVAHLTPEMSAVKASMRLPLTLVAAPVQLGSFEALATNADGVRIPVNVQLPRFGAIAATTPPSGPIASGEAQLVDDGEGPYLDRHTVPLLPYGSFLLAVRNPTPHAITIKPEQLSIVAGGKRHAVIADSGAIFGRYLLTLQGRGRRLVGARARGEISAKLFSALPFLKGDVTLAPGQRWQGYVVFDVGVYSADEYNAFLGAARTVSLELREAQSDAVAVVFPFEVACAELPAVCLPGTLTPAFQLCEVTP